MQGSPRAKALRKTSTNVENILWYNLRDRRLCGYKFRRQVALGPFIADFVCMSARVIVELDGSQHAQQVDRDRLRAAYLHRRGFQIVRFWNNEVLQNLEGALQELNAVLKD